MYDHMYAPVLLIGEASSVGACRTLGGLGAIPTGSEMYNDARSMLSYLPYLQEVPDPLPPQRSSIAIMADEIVNVRKTLKFVKTSFNTALDLTFGILQDAVDTTPDFAERDVFIRWQNYLKQAKINESISVMPDSERVGFEQWGGKYAGAIALLSKLLGAVYEKLTYLDRAKADLLVRIQDQENFDLNQRRAEARNEAFEQATRKTIYDQAEASYIEKTNFPGSQYGSWEEGEASFLMPSPTSMFLQPIRASEIAEKGNGPIVGPEDTGWDFGKHDDGLPPQDPGGQGGQFFNPPGADPPGDIQPKPKPKTDPEPDPKPDPSPSNSLAPRAKEEPSALRKYGPWVGGFIGVGVVGWLALRK